MILYHLYNENNFITHAKYYQEGKQPENAIYIVNCNFIKPFFNGLEVVEGANQEEINSDDEIKKVELKKTQYKELLKTDWYFARLAETGQEVPKEVLEERNLIRNR
jgi:hypothetical protein